MERLKKKFSQTVSDRKLAENEQNLEKKLEDGKVSRELNEKKLKRKVLAEKNTGLKEAAKKNVESFLPK